ncbi:hypothetical protein [Williamsia sp.]|uniref:hypothetical protein n=1 Tax=Williamsia sp. TaxID=1872085 RepID=UPI0025CDF231|nr:hypothetical protein [Williamsia sp.]
MRSGSPRSSRPARRFSTRLIALAVVAASLALAGCGSSSEPEAAPTSQANVYEDQRESSVLATLDRLTAAQRAGDTAAVDALIDPAATPQFRASLARQTTNVHAAGMATFRYRIDRTTALGEVLVPSDLQARLDDEGSSDSWIAPVGLQYALAGVNEPPVNVVRPLVLARYDDTWKVVGDAGPIQGEAAPTPQFWDFPGVRATRAATAGGESVVLGYPGSTALAARLTSSLPGAVAAVTAFWGTQWPRRAVLIATDSTPAFAALSGSEGADSSAAAAATVSASADAVDGFTEGQRIVFTPGSVTGLAGPALDVVLRHEMTHVAARTKTAPTSAKWVTEGVAEYVGRKGTYRRLSDAAPDLAAQVAAGDAPAALPTDAAFTVSGPQAPIAYQSAWSFAAYVAGKYGDAKLRSLYLALATGPSTADAQAAAMQAQLGAPGATVLAGWRTWLTEQARLP